MSKANAFAALMKEAKGHGVAETDRQVEETQRRDGRKKNEPRIRGKREHHDYGKIGVYVRNETIAEVKGRLLREKRELSDLVQELLDKWLNDRKS